MGALPQALEIIFEVQRKKNNDKSNKKKNKHFNLQNVFFFCSFLFGPLLPSNLITFLFLTHLKWFQVIQERHLKFYKLSWNFNSNKTTYKEFFGCLGTGQIIFEL
jgi:hypothetical protein